MPCVHERIEQQVDRTPDAIAVAFEDRTLTYRELDERANRLAHRLRALGVGPEVLVGLAVERSLEMMVGLLAIWKSGGAYVPLDPGYPAERVAFMIEDSAAPLLLTQRRLVEQLPSGGAHVVVLDDGDDAGAVERPASTARGEDLAYVIYTSGSTGRPKGAMNTHAGIANRLAWMQDAYGLTAADRVLQKTPISFDVSVWELFWPLMVGARLVVARPGGHTDGRYLIDRIEREGITTIHFVPSMLRELLETPGFERCRSLRRVICSGEALPFALQERFFACAEAELHNLYGPTEAAVDVSFFACRRGGGPTVPIGRPIANTQLYVLDEALVEVPDGEPGELHIGGIGVGRGYLRRPGLTAERFIPGPDGGRIYRTGDLARRRPDGELEYLGRIDHQVKLRGFRIELGEIEAQLERHPDVRAAVVLAREDTPGDQRLVAYVVAAGAMPPAAALCAHLATTLPPPMIPSAFVALDALPLTPSGKVDRRALPAPAAVRAGEAQPPRDALEQELVAMWEDVLGVRGVGITDSFFELGGHSLLALRLMARIEKRHGVAVQLASLLEGPTVERLAELLRRGAPRAPWSPLVRLRAGTTRPLFLVHAIGGNVLGYVKLAELLGPDQTVYGLQARGLDGAEPPVTDLREMATGYLEAVRALQPQGPYLIGGWSFGGIVAYEMAQQLRAAGERVALLAVIEARAMNAARRAIVRNTVRGFDPSLMAFWFTVITARCYGVEVGCSLADFTGLDEDQRLGRVMRELAPLQPLADASLTQLRTAFELFVTNLRALGAYAPTAYPDPMTLFRARTAVAPLPDRPTPPPFGWEEFASTVEHVDVDGTHFTLLHRDHVAGVAERLRACLGAAHRTI